VALLRARPAFRDLAAARLVSFVGDSLSLVALMLHVAATSGQAVAVAALLLVGDVAPALLSPLAGAVGDRFDRRRVMVACELVQGAALLAMALLPPLPALLALVAVRAVAGQVFAAASRAAVPALVHDRDLETANAVVGFGANGAEAVGPLVAAALLPVLGVPGVLLVDAASFGASALLLARLPGLPTGSGEGVERGSLLRGAGEGLRWIGRARPVLVVVLGFCAVVAATAIDDVALLVLATEDLGAGESAAAALLAAVGIGLLAGYLLLARTAARVPTAALLVAGFAVSSVGNLLTGLAWAVAVAFALQALRGLGIAAIDVAHVTLLQRLVPDHLLGRVFANLHGAIGVAAGLSYLGGGLLLDAIGAPTTFLIAGAVGTVAAAAVGLTLPAALRGYRPPG
jgi:MFS family permease